MPIICCGWPRMRTKRIKEQTNVLSLSLVHKQKKLKSSQAYQGLARAS